MPQPYVRSLPVDASRSDHPAARNPRDAHADDVVRVLREDGTLDPAPRPAPRSAEVVALYRAMVRTRLLDDRLVDAPAPGAHRLPHRLARRGGGHPRQRLRDAREGLDLPLLPRVRRGALARDAAPALRRQHVRQRERPGQGPADAGPLLLPRRRASRSISSPIGTQITQAVGFAWAAKIKKEDLVDARLLRRGRDELDRVPQRDELRGRVQDADGPLLPQQRLGHQRARRAADGERRVRRSRASRTACPGVRVDGNDLFAVDQGHARRRRARRAGRRARRSSRR